MKIGKDYSSIIDQELAVDNWNVVHDKHGKFSEEYNGKILIEEAKEYKYLGFVISNSASNVANILDKKRESGRHTQKYHEHYKGSWQLYS